MKHTFYVFVLQALALQLLIANSISGQSIEEVKVSIDVKKARAEEVFSILKSKTNFVFSYGRDVADGKEKYTLNYKEVTVAEILRQMSKTGRLDFKQVNNNISVKKSTLPRNRRKVSVQLPDKRITGSVRDENGDPLPGATIRVEGFPGRGDVTDAQGDFSINVPDEATALLVSFVGYLPQRVNLGGRINLNVVLEQDLAALGEVVVIGYGTQKRDELTGAISSLNINRVDKNSFSSPEQLLQGRVAGVQISGVSGNPGGQQRINIRGIGSIQGDNQPLFVVDGIPVSNTDPSLTVNAKFGGANITNPLSLLNPNDIESIEVLKDAAAASIYGSRATNGVILITTKKGGNSGRSSINVTLYTGVQNLRHEVQVAGTEQYLELQNEARSNFNADQGLVAGDNGFLAPLTDPRAPGQGDTDWIGLITQDNAEITDFNVSLNGGNERTTYYTSLGYFKQEGILLTSQLKRISSNLNIEHRFNDKLKIGNNFIGSFSNNNRVTSHNGGLRLLLRSLEQRPYDSPYNENGDYLVGGSPNLLRRNAVMAINESNSDYKSYRVINNTFLEFTPIEGLTYRPSLSIDAALYHDRVFWSPLFIYARGDGGQLTDSRNVATKYLFTNQLSYNGESGKLNYEVTFAHAFEKFNLDRTFVEGTGFPFNSDGSLASATNVRTSTFATPPQVGNAIGSNALESYVGRAILNYDDRYFLNLSFRRDGSSRFAEGRRYGSFPSASFGWKFTNESFMEDSFLESGKLRVSYGQTGSLNGVGDFAALSIVSGGYNYAGQSGALVTQPGNGLLTWEESTQFNTGADLEFASGKFRLTLDYFVKETSGLIFDQPTPSTTGFTSAIQNIGSIRNTGFEFEAYANIIEQPDLSWDLSVNFASINNELQSLTGEDIPVGGSHILREGESLGTFYTLKQLGIYQSDDEVPQTLFNQGVRAGDIRYEDLNGDGLITPADRQVVGSALPDFYGGITNNLKYKNFDLTIFSSFSVGNDILALYRQSLDNLGRNGFNNRVEAIDSRWTGPGTSNTTPRAIANSAYNNQTSTRYLEDGSFFRVKTVTLGYQFPVDLLKPIQNLRVYVSATNLLTITDYSGFDPEASDSFDPKQFGIDYGTAPQPRTFILGLNMNF